MELFVPDEAAMLTLGGQLAAALHRHQRRALVVFLEGELGTGKTTLVRGVLRGLGYCGSVKSPTYTLVEPYSLGELRLYHFDLYRLVDPEELEYLGARDYFQTDAVCFVEWPRQASGWLPPPDVSIVLSYRDPGRQVRLGTTTRSGQALLSELRKAY
jgi:tRNA threonylcarbamoyladenosine biosynthesis protein TsaE